MYNFFRITFFAAIFLFYNAVSSMNLVIKVRRTFSDACLNENTSIAESKIIIDELMSTQGIARSLINLEVYSNFFSSYVPILLELHLKGEQLSINQRPNKFLEIANYLEQEYGFRQNLTSLQEDEEDQIQII